MSKELDKEAEQRLEQVLRQIQFDYHCSFSEAVGIAKKWIHDYAAENEQGKFEDFIEKPLSM
jgi:hypothetical protein